MDSIPIPMDQKTVYFSVAMQIYMSETIKKPALKAFEILFNDQFSKFEKLKALKILWNVFSAMKGLPEPTIENTWHPNTHNMIRLRDWVAKTCKLGEPRDSFIHRIMNFIIILYDFDPPWRWIFDSLKDEAFKMKWEPRGYGDTWKDSYTWWQEGVKR